MKKIVLSLLAVAFAANLTLAQVGMQLSFGEYVGADKSSKTTENPKGNDDELHVVQKGQTLFAIATMYKTTPEKLKALNNLSDNTIVVGQKLKVPKMRGEGNVQTDIELPEGANQREIPAQDNSNDAVVSQKYHKVKSGETIYSIADTYQIAVDDLLNFNGLNQEAKIHAGDVLIVGEVKVGEREVVASIRGGGNTGGTSSATEEGSLSDLATPDTAVKSFEPIKKGNKDRDLSPTKVEETSAVAETPTEEAATKTVEFISPAVVLGKTIEVGNYMAIEDAAVQDTRYYGYHKNLPVGSVVNLHIPNNAGFVQVKIVNRLRADRKELIGLSPACIRLIGKENPTATISY